MTEPMPTPPRPTRPLGLTIAILSTAFGYGILPLSPFLLVVWASATQRGIGTELFGGPPSWAQIAFSAAILITAVLAWVGRPPWSRWLLLALVWLQTMLLVIRFIAALTTPPTLFGVGGNISGNGLWVCQAPLIVLIPLYVTWYLNRAPARAFYQRRKS